MACIEATSKGQMLAAGTPDSGSAGYVAMESVTGSLNRQHGTFVLQQGVMNRGTPQLTISVVPDSGAGSLAGLAGTMAIEITGERFYQFDYILSV